MAKQFKDLSSHTYIDLYFPAAIYAGLNNKDEAFRLLEKAYEQRLAADSEGCDLSPDTC